MNAQALIAPVNREKQFNFRVNVASCRGCINNRECTVAHQHGRVINQTETVRYKTSRLLENLPGAVQDLERMALAGTSFFDGAGPAVLAVCMEMIASEIGSKDDDTSSLLSCWRILGHHCEFICTSGHVSTFASAIDFALRRFSPTKKSSKSKQLACFAIAALVATSRVIILDHMLQALSAGDQTEGIITAVASPLVQERDQLLKMLLSSFHLLPTYNTAIGAPALNISTVIEKFEEIRESLEDWAMQTCEKCLTLNASKPFSVPSYVFKEWIQPPSPSADSTTVAIKAIGLLLLSVCSVDSWTVAAVEQLVGGTESMLQRMSPPLTFQLSNQLPLLGLRLALAVTCLDTNVQHRYRHGLGPCHQHAIVEFEHHGNPSLPTAIRLTPFQYRTYFCLRMTLRSIVLSLYNPSQASTLCFMATSLCRSTFYSLIALPLLLEALAAIQIPLEYWANANHAPNAKSHLFMLTEQLRKDLATVTTDFSLSGVTSLDSRVRVPIEHYTKCERGELFAIAVADHVRLIREGYTVEDDDRTFPEPSNEGCPLPTTFWITLASSAPSLATQLLAALPISELSPISLLGPSPDNSFTSLKQRVPSGLVGWCLAASVSPLVVVSQCGNAEHEMAREMVFSHFAHLQCALERVNRQLAKRGADYCSALPKNPRPQEASPTLFEEDLMDAVLILSGGAQHSCAVRDLIVHFSAEVSPFRTILVNKNIITDAARIRPLLMALSESYTLHHKTAQANAVALFCQSLDRHASRSLLRQSATSFHLLPPLDVARLAAACVSLSSENSQSDVQCQNDRSFGPNLVDLQVAYASVRTPFVMRSIASIFARERAYYLPDTKLLARIRDDLILPWQPDLRSLFKPAFHQAMLLAACALVGKGLPVDIVLWNIIRPYVPSVLQEKGYIESGVSVANRVVDKCSIA